MHFRLFYYTLFLIVYFSSVNTYAQIRKDTIQLDNGDLYYEVYGSGEPLLMLHGWTQSHAFWEPYVSDFQDAYQIYLPDLHGHGNSGILNDDFSIQRAAEDLLQFMDKLKLEKVRIIGMSFGGILAHELASRHPERIEAMVLIGTVYDYNGADQNQDGFDWKQLPEEFIRSLYAIHPAGEPQLSALFSPDTNYQIKLSSSELGRIPVKTLIISGDRDTVAGWKTAVELHEFLPNSQLWIVPDKGHIPIDDFNHDEFVKNVVVFFTEGIR